MKSAAGEKSQCRKKKVQTCVEYIPFFDDHGEGVDQHTRHVFHETHETRGIHEFRGIDDVF